MQQSGTQSFYGYIRVKQGAGSFVGGGSRLAVAMGSRLGQNLVVAAADGLPLDRAGVRPVVLLISNQYQGQVCFLLFFLRALSWIKKESTFIVN